jgi:hypothetical protein
MQTRFILAASVSGLCLAAAATSGQLAQSFTPARQHPAIGYAKPTADDAAAVLNAKLKSGEVKLEFEPVTGYLRSLLQAFDIDLESQLLVFSKTSFQSSIITPTNPRSLYFRDDVAVGWVKGGDVVEVAAQDPRQGTIFYTLDQKPGGRPALVRNDACVSCHLSTATFDVPGMFAASMYVGPDGRTLYAPVFETDHRSRFDQRWGGWYVTGRHGTARHMGNGTVKDESDLANLIQDRHQNLTSLDDRVDLSSYLARTSDIVALMVLEHQMHMANMFTRLAWEARLATPEARAMRIVDTPRPGERIIEATRVGAKGIAELTLRPIDEAVRETVDYMLFVHGAPFDAPIEGTSGFAERFAHAGPRDSNGRSLRDLDLETRLLRYPLTYMIHSAQFDALPAGVKEATFARLWDVLSGADTAPRYQERLPLSTRRAIVEILAATIDDLPDSFDASTLK